jgi:hypothetical protein
MKNKTHTKISLFIVLVRKENALINKIDNKTLIIFPYYGTKSNSCGKFEVCSIKTIEWCASYFSSLPLLNIYR